DAVSGELGGLPASSAKAAWLKQRERHATAAVRAKFMEPSPKGRWSMVSRMRHGDALDFWPVHAQAFRPPAGFCVSALQNQPPSNSNDSGSPLRSTQVRLLCPTERARDFRFDHRLGHELFSINAPAGKGLVTSPTGHSRTGACFSEPLYSTLAFGVDAPLPPKAALSRDQQVSIPRLVA